MFVFVDDSSRLFALLDENLKSSLKLHHNQAIILNEPSFHLIIYSKSGNEEKLMGFEIPDTADFTPTAHLLLTHLHDLVVSGKPEFEPALEELSEFMMGLDTPSLFFDAH